LGDPPRGERGLDWIRRLLSVMGGLYREA
jgi:hypothetical protein